MSGIPILGANGRGAVPSPTKRKYLVEVTTTDGGTHGLTMSFDLPTGANGAVQLDGLKNFDPDAQAAQAILNVVTQALRGQVGCFRSEEGVQVLWHQIVSWRFVGAVDDQPVRGW